RLDIRAVVGEETVAKPGLQDRVLRHAGEHRFGAGAGLLNPGVPTAEDDPADVPDRAVGDQLEDRAAAADLRVVRMPSQQEHVERRGDVDAEANWQRQAEAS